MKNKTYIKTQYSDKYIKVSVDYSLGGLNYISGDKSPRGVYAYVQPVTHEKRTLSDGTSYTAESFVLFTGLKHLVIPLNRKSDKKVQEAMGIVEKSLSSKSGIVWDMVQVLANKDGLVVNS